MNKEMKKILSGYIFRCVIITCLLCFCAGIVTAKQRSEYNSYFTPYAVMTLKNSADTINITVDDKQYSLDMSRIKSLSEYKNYLYFTPFSCGIFVLESFFSLFSTFKG